MFLTCGNLGCTSIAQGGVDRVSLEPALTALASLSFPHRLGNCDITAACCATLANVMVTKQNLTELDLSYNTLEDEGVMKLCEAVRNPNCKMQQLM